MPPGRPGLGSGPRRGVAAGGAAVVAVWRLEPALLAAHPALQDPEPINWAAWSKEIDPKLVQEFKQAYESELRRRAGCVCCLLQGLACAVQLLCCEIKNTCLALPPS